jgi:hypothetical protein
MLARQKQKQIAANRMVKCRATRHEKPVDRNRIIIPRRYGQQGFWKSWEIDTGHDMYSTIRGMYHIIEDIECNKITIACKCRHNVWYVRIFISDRSYCGYTAMIDYTKQSIQCIKNKHNPYIETSTWIAPLVDYPMYWTIYDKVKEHCKLISGTLPMTRLDIIGLYIHHDIARIVDSY